jgi:hypothetical protein
VYRQRVPRTGCCHLRVTTGIGRSRFPSSRSWCQVSGGALSGTPDLSRADSGLPDRHTASVKATDSQGKDLPTLEYVLDWTTRRDRVSMTTYGEHDAANALIEISKAVQRWGEGHPAHGLAVTVRDGDAKDDRAREQLDERGPLKPAPGGDATCRTDSGMSLPDATLREVQSLCPRLPWTREGVAPAREGSPATISLPGRTGVSARR